MNKVLDILYVDDEKTNLFAFKANFRKQYNIHTCLSTTEAEIILQEKTVGILLIDHNMPQETGLDFLERINQQYPEVIRILVTAYADYSRVAKVMNSGALQYSIKKPWIQKEMETCLFKAHQEHVRFLELIDDIEDELLTSPRIKTSTKLNFQYITVPVPTKVKAAFIRYLHFFQKFVFLVLNRNVHFEIKEITASSVTLEINPQDDWKEINFVFHAYMDFIKNNLSELQGFIELGKSDQRANLHEYLQIEINTLKVKLGQNIDDISKLDHAMQALYDDSFAIIEQIPFQFSHSLRHDVLELQKMLHDLSDSFLDVENEFSRMATYELMQLEEFMTTYNDIPPIQLESILQSIEEFTLHTSQVQNFKILFRDPKESDLLLKNIQNQLIQIIQNIK